MDARPVGRHVAPNNNSQGWGVVALVLVLALAVNSWAFWVHKTHYRNPIHPSSVEPNEAGEAHETPGAQHSTEAPVAH